MLFSSGYLANMGTLDAHVGRGDACSRTSSTTRGSWTGPPVPRGRCRSTVTPISSISTHSFGSWPLRATDRRHRHGLLDGRRPGAAAEIVGACERAKRCSSVDEAHATGVSGPAERRRRALGLEGRVPVVVGTLSKALGAAGRYVAGPRLISYLPRTARGRTFRHRSAAAAAVAAASAALDIARGAEPDRPTRPRACARLAAGLRAAANAVGEPTAAVVPGRRRRRRSALALSRARSRAGRVLPGHPSAIVPPGTSRSARHRDGDAQDEHRSTRPVRAFAQARVVV